MFNRILVPMDFSAPSDAALGIRADRGHALRRIASPASCPGRSVSRALFGGGLRA